MTPMIQTSCSRCLEVARTRKAAIMLKNMTFGCATSSEGAFSEVDEDSCYRTSVNQMGGAESGVAGLCKFHDHDSG